MRNKTESRILNILNQNDGLTASQIEEILDIKKHYVTYDTIARNLKRMTEEEKISREAKGKPWHYYYRLNKGYKSK